MEFISILICLAIERWTNFGKVIRDFKLLERYISFMQSLIKKIHLKGLIGTLFFLIPMLLIVGVIYYILLHVLFGLVGILFAILILIYCLGTFDFHKIPIPRKQNATETEKVTAIFINANRNIFSIIFWFAVIGPVGAILYRLNEAIENHHELDAMSESARGIRELLDWIPVRLMTLSLALVSHFILVISNWTKFVFVGLSSSDEMLAKCGFASIEGEGQEKITDIYSKALEIVDRTLILWLVIMALFILL